MTAFKKCILPILPLGRKHLKLRSIYFTLSEAKEMHVLNKTQFGHYSKSSDRALQPAHLWHTGYHFIFTQITCKTAALELK